MSPSVVLAALLLVALAVAVVTDLRSRIIPNELNAAIALAAPLSWWFAGLSVWPDIAVQVGIAVAVVLAVTPLFAIGQMGGGDVKLLGALSLWFPWMFLSDLLQIVVLSGGALTTLMLVRQLLVQSKRWLAAAVAGFALAFAGLLLGGAELLASLSAWLPLVGLLALVIVSVPLILSAARSVKQAGVQLEVPYGVAIAAGGVWTVSRTLF